jgi:hypothetical protein
MANEGTVTVSLSFNKSSRSASLGKTGLQFDIDGLDYVKKTQNIGTTEEAINLGDITTPGYFVAVNRSTTYNIRIRPATAVADLIVLEPGDVCCFRMYASAPFCIAITGSAELEYLLIED